MNPDPVNSDSEISDSQSPEKAVQLPEPDRDNITVLSHELPNEPILPWRRFDSPWLDGEEKVEDGDDGAIAQSEDEGNLEEESAPIEQSGEPSQSESSEQYELSERVESERSEDVPSSKDSASPTQLTDAQLTITQLTDTQLTDAQLTSVQLTESVLTGSENGETTTQPRNESDRVSEPVNHDGVNYGRPAPDLLPENS